MRLCGVKRLLAAAFVGIGVLAAAATAPAQQVPPGSPQNPGLPTPPGIPPGGPPTAMPGPSLPPSPLPEASASAAPSSPAGSPTLAPAQPANPVAQPAAGTAPAGLVRFSGQLLDLRNGYVFFTTGDAFKASPAIRLIDLDTGGATTLVPSPQVFARASLDSTTGSIVELALTKRRLAQDAAYQQAYAKAHSFVVAGSATVAAPELNRGVRVTGRAVAVTFYVQVPPTTALTDNVFITTDASGWVPNAMKMDRIDALHYRLTRSYASGTKFAYRYTRGSWTSVEVGEDGLQDDAHQFFVPEVDAKRLTDLVYRWSDQDPTQQQVGPDSIPTPFNPNPFGGLPTTVRPGIPQATPTPRP